MTAKEYLQQCWDIERQIKSRKETIEVLSSIVGAKTTSYDNDGSKFSPNPDKNSEIMCQIADLSKEIDNLQKIFCDIALQIQSVKNSVERFILESRYLHNKQWSWIIEELHYNSRSVFRIHGQALQKIIVKKF
jgi:DNA-directed RNA polymerase specialized sigma subunit